ncbi:MAG: tRNA (N6-isopentenyl adenosine(37)-C2)-methylthiotransferase MiaB [Acidobacteria bacterium]|nr:tRNA (N6-isopentenyl adenosine(37)-C2)-methylthiotransferase MiaB [Acidobacteriota bacterium]
MGKTFYIETFGCQMNVHDSEKVAGTLLQAGYEPVDRPEQADLVLYNTCSIREKAAQKVFSRLSQFRTARQQGKLFGVLGCVAQQEGERIFEAAPHVSLVVGSASYVRLPQLLAQLEQGEHRASGLRLDTEEPFETEFARRGHPFRAYVTIIEGCDKQCAYCVVPFTRGPERSRTSQSVLREARQLADAGYTEIQLLGQNVNSYRDPSPARLSFSELLAKVAEIPAIRRVRFTTSHPRDFGRDIVEIMDRHPALCNHVHLPVQSGSTRVLHRMQREYTREDYLRRVEWIRSARRSISVTTDIIVGFPGETENDFEETMTLLDEVGYDSVFSFQYSPRPNTEALRLPHPVPEEEKGRRLRILQERQREIQFRRYQARVGTVEEVLVEGRSGRGDQWKGRTPQNIVLNFTAPGEWASQVQPGGYWRVRVTEAGPNSLIGQAIEGAACLGLVTAPRPGLQTPLPIL